MRIRAFILSFILLLTLCACGAKPEEISNEIENDEQAAEIPVTAQIAALKGPTAMGLAKLMSDMPESANGPLYHFTLAGSADEITPKLIKGDIDIACVPANLASVLYNKTSGGIEVLAINTLGVLYIVEQGNTITSVSDLVGKSIVASGKGATPEYVLRYLLLRNGIDPDRDVSISWKSEHSECMAALASGTAAVALLPQPFAAAAQGKIEGLRIAIDLNEEWEKLDSGSALITGVAVVRRDFAEKHPAALGTFLSYYAASVDWVNANISEAAMLIGEQGIVDAAIAEKALPCCNIVCISGEEMQQKLSAYLQVLFDAAPESVGGTLPDNDFYYMPDGK